jgi:Dolichyl-phosphate-mannose-protein mannosyltransferase
MRIDQLSSTELVSQREPGHSRIVWKLAALLAAALCLRLFFFTGLALGDDVFYATQALGLSQSGKWPPEPLHWHTRLGIVAPTALCIKLFGISPLSFVLWPLIASTTSVLVSFFVARDLIDVRTAWLAAVFQAVFPLELIYSTHLFPDVIVAFFSVLSIWCWIRALRSDRSGDYFWSGVFFAAGYLCRETVLMEGPIYLALWAYTGRLWRPRMAWVFLTPFAILCLEGSLYSVTTGSALYRWKAVIAQQADAQNLELIQANLSGGNFWTDPLLMIATHQEFALYQLSALGIALYALWFWKPCRPLALWLLVGFVWLYYGTTVPTRWVNLQRDPRYAACLTTPAVILLAFALNCLSLKRRWTILTILVTTGLFAAGLDQGRTIRTPHRQFVASEYSTTAALEPFEYFAARWELGLSLSPDFSCADDLGRPSVCRLIADLSGSKMVSMDSAQYIVFSSDRRPDLLKRLNAAGWVTTESIPGEPTRSRSLVARLLAWIPSQQERAYRIAHPPGLIILANPKWEKQNLTSPSRANIKPHRK